MKIVDKTMFEYDKLNEVTKEYFNNSSKIYNAIKDKHITYENKDRYRVGYSESFILTDIDKKVIALFLAPLLMTGELNDLYQNYADIKLSQAEDFLNIDLEKIGEFKEEDYKEFYDESFRFYIQNLFSSISDPKILHFLEPESIISYLRLDNVSGSNIIEDFMKKYDPKFVDVLTSKLFNSLETKCELDGSIELDQEDLIERRKDRSSFFNFITPPGFQHRQIDLPPLNPIDIEMHIVKPLAKPDEDVKSRLLNKKTWDLMDELSRKFIGQEEAAKQIFLNIINNQCLIDINDLTASQKSTIFIDGASGTGKTAIIKAIAKKLDIPFVKVAATKFSKVGYVGESLDSIFKKLLEKAGGNIEKAQKGIVVLDEMDKLGINGDIRDLSMKKALQEELLDILSGGKYNLDQGLATKITGQALEFDTSKVTFIGIGALTELREEKIEKETKSKSMGFKNSDELNRIKKRVDYTIDKQDLIDYGIIPELANRFNTFLHTVDYDAETLKEQLIRSEISPMLALKQWVEFFDKKLVVTDEIYDLIAEEAYNLKAGARGNETVVDSIRTLLLEKVLKGTDDEIVITPELVRQANNQRTSRNGVR